MLIAEMMTTDVRTIAPTDTVRRAAQLMDDINVGVLPVCEDRVLLGIVTDRDIATRAPSAGLCTVEQIMSAWVDYCFENDDSNEVAQRMAKKQIRRLPVLDRGHHVVGIVTLGDLSSDGALTAAAMAFEPASRPSNLDL
jgi:CBS domain-containing protein